jgi:hypothetical protein
MELERDAEVLKVGEDDEKGTDESVIWSCASAPLAARASSVRDAERRIFAGKEGLEGKEKCGVGVRSSDR